MYTTAKKILDHASENNYGVIAACALNMELARGIIAAADEKQAPVIILIGQNQMIKHAQAELMAPMIKIIAEETNVPVALILDHGREWTQVTNAFRSGFSSIMIDASAYPFAENVARTKKVVELCHAQGLSVEGELGHVGQAAAGDGQDSSIYTKPEEALAFIAETGVDCLAIACGTAHGKYPKGFVPTINYDIIKNIKKVTKTPLALHGSSGSGDENVRKAVEAGINKVNVCTDILNYCRDAAYETLQKNPEYDTMQLLIDFEHNAKEITKRYIDLTCSAGKAPMITRDYTFTHGRGKTVTGVGE